MPDRMTIQTYRVRILPLTDLHVGSGETAIPGEYFVFPKDLHAYFIDLGQATTRNAKLREFVLREMKQPQWLTTIRQQPGFVSYVKEHARFVVEMGDDATDIHEKWDQHTTSLTVSLLPRTIQGPIIPGSSVKGAIRTALVAQAWTANDHYPVPPHPNAAAEWERQVMGATPNYKGRFDISSDPLNVLKVGDLSPQHTIPDTILHRIQREGMAPGGDAADLQDYRECLPGVMLTDGTAYYLDGQFTLTVTRGQEPALTAPMMLQRCQDYYAGVLQQEIFYWRQKDQDTAGLYEALMEEGSDNEALIRIGWGSGQTALRIPDGPSPKTRALVGGYPPGWALLRIDEGEA
ncbi:MAG: RAMP superfamily protein [bacterium ADurb.Bin429]|nr:MAG: RAMP superfamily protein [bacterium ADurb.Bin429]